MADATAVEQQRATVGLECHAALETDLGDEPVDPRLRTVGGSLAAIVTEAIARSTTFRQLVQAIGRTDGIVYVEHGPCGHGVRACLLAVMTAGAYRILRVRVAANKTDWDLMGSIGHELQHAVEVLGNPAVTNTIGMHIHYAHEGYRVGNVFETAAAVRAGNDVRAEVRRTSPGNAWRAGHRAASLGVLDRVDRCPRMSEGRFASASARR